MALPYLERVLPCLSASSDPLAPFKEQIRCCFSKAVPKNLLIGAPSPSCLAAISHLRVVRGASQQKVPSRSTILSCELFPLRVSGISRRLGLAGTTTPSMPRGAPPPALPACGGSGG
ncbi:uncharacterized protein ACOB8E_015215 [Sarcophilus harrisii]